MKKMTLFSLGLMSLAMFTSSCGGGTSADAVMKDSTTTAVEEVLTVNLDSSQVLWKGEMLDVYSHEGTIKLTEATLKLVDGKVSGGNFVVDMKSITPTDKNYDVKKGNTPEKLIAHLSAADFFLVDSFPTSSFMIKGTDSTSAVTGTLTLRGKTGEEKVTDVVVTNDSNVYKISGKLVVNRQNYGVAYKAAMKDMVLSDDLQLNISIYATK